MCCCPPCCLPSPVIPRRRHRVRMPSKLLHPEHVDAGLELTDEVGSVFEEIHKEQAATGRPVVEHAKRREDS